MHAFAVPGSVHRIRLRPVVDIALPRHAVFCSCVSAKHDGYTCYYRRHAHLGNRLAQKILLDDNFNIRAYGNNTIIAEDPRLFKWGDQIVAFDNFLDDMHLVWEDNRRVRVPLRGKNLSPMPISDTEIAFVDIQDAQRHVCGLVSGRLQCQRPDRLRQHNKPQHCSPRGGTAAMLFGATTWGVGHCTFTRNPVSHSIVSWALDNGAIWYNVYRPPHPSSQIIDATSVVNKSGVLHLITAESTNVWFAPWDNQLYSNRVYRLLLRL